MDLGLHPHYLSDTLVESVFGVIERHKDRVHRETIMPKTTWKGTPADRDAAEPVASP
jgi:UDP-sulfoquinovose synthase